MREYLLKNSIWWFLLNVLLPIHLNIASATDLYPFSNTQQQQQFAQLTENSRCLVCQNESLADSQAPLARILRTEIYNKIRAGESTESINHYLVQRYGEFVLFKPSFNKHTYFLWLTPIFLLLIGLFILLKIVKTRKNA